MSFIKSEHIYTKSHQFQKINLEITEEIEEGKDNTIIKTFFIRRASEASQRSELSLWFFKGNRSITKINKNFLTEWILLPYKLERNKHIVKY